MRITLEDGTVYESEVPIIDFSVVPPEEGWLIEEGDGQVPALQLADENFESRPSSLPETNMTFPDRPIDIFGKVSPNGKVITDLNRNFIWWEWISDCIGLRNAEAMRTPGDGYMDTNQTATDLKLMSATAGGNYRSIKKIFLQNGVSWCELDLLDFNATPVRHEDGWYYIKPTFLVKVANLLGIPPEGIKMTYRSHPQYFNVRTNRRYSKVVTWLTAGEINICNDVGLKGGKGHEAWPAVSKQRVAQRLADLFLFPSLPLLTEVYKESLIIDGILAERSESVSVIITKYKVNGPDIYGYDDVRSKWYKLTEMLIRGTLENRDGGNGYDWRCYCKNFIPNRRACPAPDCGWIRP